MPKPAPEDLPPGTVPADLIENNYLLKIRSYPQIFTPEECEQIIAMKPLGKSWRSQISGEGIENSKIRNSTSIYIPNYPETQWVSQRIMPLIQDYNQYLKFDISLLSPLQVIEYQENDFYTWHVDVGDTHLSTRKISIVTFLSAPDTYEGGQLKIVIGTNSPTVSQEQGTVFMFPSYMLHHVEPVIRGVRYTLVLWVHGNAFR